MASFSFGFQFPEEKPTSVQSTAISDQDLRQIDSDIRQPAFQVDVGNMESFSMKVPTDPLHLITEAGSEVTLLKVDEDSVQLSEELVTVLDDAEADTDLVPHVYEGGLRVWECSLDLVRYIHDHQEIFGTSAVDADDELSAKHCLELGCGHGFPGIEVLRRAQNWTVCFTDLNEDVLQATTWPSIALNVPGSLKDRVSFIAGDWLSLDSVMGSVNKFDLILTAETCYTEQHCDELASLLHKHLSHSPSASALVACKRYYFGTGGGTGLFRQACERQGIFSVTSLAEFNNGRSNIREILQVRRLTNPEA